MSERPLISVIIAAHGGAWELPALLTSIYRQKQNIEVAHSRIPNLMCKWGAGELTERKLKGRFLFETVLSTDGACEISGMEQDFCKIDKLIECPKEGHVFIGATLSKVDNCGVGHNTRGPGIEAATGEWIVLTNMDNYFMLGWADRVMSVMAPDVGAITWNGINNLWGWTDLGGVRIERGRIDLSFIAVRSDIAKAVGFPWREYDGDYDYIASCKELCSQRRLKIMHLVETLSVHN